MAKIVSDNIHNFIDRIYEDDPKGASFTHNLYDFINVKFISNWQTLHNALKQENGYVAGGFARWIFFAYKNKYVQQAMKLDEIIDYTLYYYTQCLYGDVDVWFENEEGLKRAVAESEDPDRRSAALSTENAISWRLMDLSIPNRGAFNKNNLICQYIKCVHGEPASIIQTFDIKNGMILVDFKQEKVYYEHSIPELEKNNMVSFSNHSLDQKDVIHRVHKYILKHEFKSICKDDGSLKFLIKWAHKNLDEKSSSLTQDGLDAQRCKLHQLMNHPSLIDIKELPLLIGIAKTDLDTSSYLPDYGTLVDAATKAVKERSKGRSSRVYGSMAEGLPPVDYQPEPIKF